MSKTIEFSEKDRDKHQVLTLLLGLKDLDVIGNEYDEVHDTMYLYCAARWEVSVCPHCGELSNQIHDYPKQRRIHDAPIRGQKTMLLFDAVRFDCSRCKKPFTQSIRDVVAGCTYTHRLEVEMSDPNRKQDVATLAKLYGVGYKLAERIVLKAGQAKEVKRRDLPIQVEHLGIDELSQKKDRETMFLF